MRAQAAEFCGFRRKFRHFYGEKSLKQFGSNHLFGTGCAKRSLSQSARTLLYVEPETILEREHNPRPGACRGLRCSYVYPSQFL